MYFHSLTMEDIINRGGGNLCTQLYNFEPDGELVDKAGTVSIDGIQHPFNIGESIALG